MTEEWKEIPGYSGRYFISSTGKVKAVYKYRNERILSPMLNKDGYFQVNLSDGKKISHHRIHRLVAEAFVDNPNNLRMVNHKDEDKLNNKRENLEWCDHKYNINYGTRTKRSFDTRKSKKLFGRILTKQKAEEIRKKCIPYDNEFGIKKIAKEYGVSSTTVSSIVHEKAWKE